MLNWPAVVRGCALGSSGTFSGYRSLKIFEVPGASLLRKDRSPKRPRLAACSLFPEKETLRCDWYFVSFGSRVVSTKVLTKNLDLCSSCPVRTAGLQLANLSVLLG